MPEQFYDRAVRISIDGAALDQTKYRVGNVNIDMRINDHSTFEVEVVGVRVGDALAAEGGNADLASLATKLGSKIAFASTHTYMSGLRRDELSFKGYVTAVDLRTDVERGFVVVLQGHGASVKLATAPRNFVFKDVTASDVIQTIVQKAGLSADVDATSEQFPWLIQRGETDWEFVCKLAAQAGMHVYADQDKILVKKEPAAGSFELNYASEDIALYSFSLRTRARSGSSVRQYAWDFGKGKGVLVSDTGQEWKKPASPAMKRAVTASKQLFAKGTTDSAEPLLSPGTQSVLEADTKSLQAQWLSSLAASVGESDHLGLVAGAKVGVGLGGDLGNSYLITRVVHRWNNETLEYRNRFECVPAEAAAPPRPVHRAKDHDLWTGRVTGIKGAGTSFEGGGWVTVQLLNVPDHEFNARLSSTYLGKQGGWLAYPEIGDEVIVAFVDGDWRYPVVLGSVMHPKDLSEAYKLVDPGIKDGKNDHKVFRTRTGQVLHFVETKDQSTITLKSANDETILLMDATKDKVSISIKSTGDVHVTAKKNINLTADENVSIKAGKGITIEAEQDIVMKSKANVNVEATQNLTAKATQNTTIEGMQVEAKSQASSVKASPSGVDVKGPMIKLN